MIDTIVQLMKLMMLFMLFILCFLIIKVYGFKKFLYYITSGDFRLREELRCTYLNHSKLDPPTSPENIRKELAMCIEKADRRWISDRELERAQDMIKEDDFLKFFFMEKQWNVTTYEEMNEDYRIGNYCSKPYATDKKLKDILKDIAKEISDNDGNLELFMRLIVNGWVSFPKDSNVKPGLEWHNDDTGEIALTAYVLCCSIMGFNKYAKIFGEIFGIKPDIIAGRINKLKAAATKHATRKGKPLSILQSLCEIYPEHQNKIPFSEFVS